MGKKRRSDSSTRLDEVDRSMYTTFSGAANSLSQLYTQAMHQQKLSFQAGERHALVLIWDELANLIAMGCLPIVLDVSNILLIGTWKLDSDKKCRCNEDDKLYNWILRQQEYGSRMTLGDITSYLELGCGKHITRNTFRNELEYIPEESPLRSMNSDHQPKNSSVFSNALSSPVRRTLQHYHLPQGVDNATPSLNTHRSTENGYRESNAPTSNDSSMDMQADSPAHKSSY
ncbi:hypothetical protein LguiA_003312 [Lonicera macranthoides]